MINPKILVINGHPDKESYNTALVTAYIHSAKQSAAQVDLINVADLNFNVNLQYGYRKRTGLEPDLIASWAKIQMADHIVWFYPIWWGSMPAILKGFIDRLFLPGMAFKKRENSVWWDKYLIGKSARIITTLDQPVWYYWLINGRPSYYAMKKMTLQFCGINPVYSTSIGPLRLSKDSFRKKWIDKIKKIGIQDAYSKM